MRNTTCMLGGNFIDAVALSRNGNASDYRSQGWKAESLSLWLHSHMTCVFFADTDECTARAFAATTFFASSVLPELHVKVCANVQAVYGWFRRRGRNQRVASPAARVCASFTNTWRSGKTRFDAASPELLSHRVYFDKLCLRWIITDMD